MIGSGDTSSSHQQLEPTPPPHSQEQETLLVKYSLDGKEASLVTAFLDASSQLLWITFKQDSLSGPLDLLQLKVRRQFAGSRRDLVVVVLGYI